MIYADPSNYRIGSNIPHCEGEMITPGLEDKAGCDYLVSPENFPITKRYHVQEHLEAGAVLVALKIGADLVSSIGDRLKGHMVKMLAFNCYPCQRALLAVGYCMSSEGQIYLGQQSKSANTVFGVEARKLLNGGYTPNYQAYNTALVEWCLRGGVVLPTVPRLDMLPWALQQLERIVIESSKDPSRYHLETPCKMPDVPNPDRQSLQVLIPVEHGVNIMLAWPGVGKERAPAYYKYYEGDVLLALTNLMSTRGSWPEFEDRKQQRTLSWSADKARALSAAMGYTPKEVTHA